MQKKISVMDVEIAVMDESVLISKIDEYLLDDVLNTILFVSMDGLAKSSENEALRQHINTFDIVLPGERALLELAGEEGLSEYVRPNKSAASYDTLGTVLETLWKNNRTLFIIGRNETEIEHLQSYCKMKQPELQIVGSYSFERELAKEALVNEINSYAPDMLLIILEPEMQASWIADNRQLLNAKLAVAIGGGYDVMVAAIGEVPKFWKTIHCGWFYKFLFQRNVQEKVKKRIFKTRLEQYNKMRNS